jgi:Flp pilus assembly protein TadG
MHLRHRRGQATVEAAMVTLVLLITVIGIFDMCQVFFVCQTLTERATNAARWAAVNSFNPGAITNLVLYRDTAAPAGSPPGIFGLTSSMVSVTRQNAGTDEDRVTVAISGYPYQVFTPLIAGTLPSTRPIVVSIPYEAN